MHAEASFGAPDGLMTRWLTQRSRTAPSSSYHSAYSAARPGCWPGRTLPTTGCPQPGRPRSGCAPLAGRATRSPRAHGSLPYGQPSAPVGLRIRAYSSPLRGLLPAACSARPTPPSGLMQGLRGRVVSVRHARPAAHTLRAVVRSAALSGLSAHVQSISQRGRQRHPAGVTPTVTASNQRPHPRSRIRHVAAPQEAATEP